MHVLVRVQTSLRRVPRCALILLFLLLGCGTGRAEPLAGYNVLLISLDTLRADHLSCYGYKRATSPRIDQVAKESVLFENVVAASSWTIPSHMSLLTSQYPSVHGVENENMCLGEAVPTLAQVLAKQGYTTAAFVTGPMLNHRFGFHRGFQLYDDFTATVMCEMNLFEDHAAKRRRDSTRFRPTTSSPTWPPCGSSSTGKRSSFSSCIIGIATPTTSPPRPMTGSSILITEAKKTAATLCSVGTRLKPESRRWTWPISSPSTTAR